MPRDDRSTGKAATDGRLYLFVGALAVAVLVGAYILMGTPGLHSQIANAPGGQSAPATHTTTPALAPAPAGRDPIEARSGPDQD
jgi:hypothetical protein